MNLPLNLSKNNNALLVSGCCDCFEAYLFIFETLNWNGYKTEHKQCLNFFNYGN